MGQFFGEGAFGSIRNYIVALPAGGLTDLPIAFTDGDTGIYEVSANRMAFVTASVRRALIDGTSLVSGVAGSWRLTHTAGTSTNPSFTNSDDSNTGMGFAALDSLSLIAKGTEVIRLGSSVAIITGTANADSFQVLNSAGVSAFAGAVAGIVIKNGLVVEVS